jgi:hypothetical protein
LNSELKIIFENQFSSHSPASKNIAIAGVIICSPCDDFENMDFYDLISKIPLLKDLQNEKKLIFVHIKESIQNVILSHEDFPVREKYSTSFQRMIRQLKKDKKMERLEKRVAELEKMMNLNINLILLMILLSFFFSILFRSITS